MSRTRSQNRIKRDTVATMLQVAGLEVAEERLDELSGLLESARDVAAHLDDAASRVSLGEGLAEFDPAWPVGERRA